MTTEFSRALSLDSIGETRAHEMSANDTERHLVAARFDLRGVQSLEARFDVRKDAKGIRVTGRVTADVIQACVTSGGDVRSSIDEPVDLLFVSPENLARAEEEVELSGDDCETLPLENRSIDLGEIAAQTLGLALDPYPRLSDAEIAEARRLLMSEEAAAKAEIEAKAAKNPFAVLKGK